MGYLYTIFGIYAASLVVHAGLFLGLIGNYLYFRGWSKPWILVHALFAVVLLFRLLYLIFTEMYICEYMQIYYAGDYLATLRSAAYYFYLILFYAPIVLLSKGYSVVKASVTIPDQQMSFLLVFTMVVVSIATENEDIGLTTILCFMYIVFMRIITIQIAQTQQRLDHEIRTLNEVGLGNQSPLETPLHLKKWMLHAFQVGLNIYLGLLIIKKLVQNFILPVASYAMEELIDTAFLVFLFSLLRYREVCLIQVGIDFLPELVEGKQQVVRISDSRGAVRYYRLGEQRFEPLSIFRSAESLPIQRSISRGSLSSGSKVQPVNEEKEILNSSIMASPVVFMPQYIGIMFPGSAMDGRDPNPASVMHLGLRE